MADDDCLFKMLWQSFQKLLRYFSLDQSGPTELTDNSITSYFESGSLEVLINFTFIKVMHGLFGLTFSKQ